MDKTTPTTPSDDLDAGAELYTNGQLRKIKQLFGVNGVNPDRLQPALELPILATLAEAMSSVDLTKVDISMLRRSTEISLAGVQAKAAFVSLFPVYWTISTSFKVAKDVQQGHWLPWIDYQPNWLGWRVSRRFPHG